MGSAAVKWLSQEGSDVPSGDDWLTVDEHGVAVLLSVPKRRSDWRLGRWTAKRLLGEVLSVEQPEKIEIVAAADGAPEAFVDGQAVPLALSISHSGDRGFCVCHTAPVGGDIERVEQRAEAFVRDFFTGLEIESVEGAAERQRSMVVTVLWSAKESALKALRVGLREDTRSVEVSVGTVAEGGWRRLEARYAPRAAVLHGWWRLQGEYVCTIVTTEPTAEPHAVRGIPDGC